jgi:hypothetical protein
MTSASSEGEPGEALALLNLIDEHGAARWKTGFLEARRERSSAAAADKLATNIRREIEQILAAWNRRAPAVPPNWQDIATAPKDGSVLLGWIVAPQEDWLDAFEAPSLIHWDAGFKSSISERKAGWVAQWRGAPTHWMPLPPPPEAASQPDSVNEGSAGGQA